MKMKFANLICFLSLTLYARLSTAGYCRQSYKCRYKTGCGLWSLKTCTRYKVCYRQVCCAGYSGENCNAGCSAQYQPRPGDPTKYLQNVNGVWVERDCAIGTVYNPTLCVCDFGTTTTPNLETGCSAQYRPRPGDRTKYLQYNNGVWVERDCGLGTVYNPTSCVCDFGTTTTPNPDTGCSAQYRPKPGDPTKYLQYNNGVWVDRDCGLGTVFNPTSCVCDFGTTTTPNP